jgi:hypothetical protein
MKASHDTKHHGQSWRPVPAVGTADGAINIDGGRPPILGADVSQTLRTRHEASIERTVPNDLGTLTSMLGTSVRQRDRAEPVSKLVHRLALTKFRSLRPHGHHTVATILADFAGMNRLLPSWIMDG